jgi:hypothetical protein
LAEASPGVRALLREALESEGRVSLSRLVQELVPIDRLREVARQHDIAPKGYRVERAPAARLIPLLVDPKQPDVVEEVLQLLLDGRPVDPRPAGEETRRLEELEARIKLRDSDLAQVRRDLARCRSQAARQREREAELAARLDAAEGREAAAKAEIEDARRRALSVANASTRDDRDRRIRELEREVETLIHAEEQLRRMVAERQARVRVLEEQIADLETRVPKGRKAPKEVPQAPKLADQFRVPHFSPGFYKSLEGRDRRHLEQTIQAALLFCTEGPSYPGLEVKQIEGQELWSLRASLKLRVYFVFLDGGAVEFVSVADREDQHTTLRRLKER